jgi:hypothetical protein
MKKYLLILVCFGLAVTGFSQENEKKTKAKQKIDLSNRPNDHLLFQAGVTNWNGLPDTINKSGLSKSFNGYFMFDFPFKTNPNLSIALGPGISSDHILFTKTHVGIRDGSPTIRFLNMADTNHYKKTKLATVFLEAPIELRYSSEPLTGKGFKAAIGVKVGTLLNAHTRNVKFQDKDNKALNEFTVKESSKHFFNKNRLSLMARAGYGHITLYGSYSLTPVFRDGLGPVVRPYSIGITLSGL